MNEILGLGPDAETKLISIGITNTFQLLGKFLLLCTDNRKPIDVCSEFWGFLKEAHVNAFRSEITRCIAEKVEAQLPGSFDYASLLKIHD